MSGLSVVRYDASRKSAWDAFVAASKNGTFLFFRDYMEYHADRFRDHSLLVFEGTELKAIFPANEKDGALVSHGGLTYGGVVSGPDMTTPAMLEVFQALLEYSRKAGLSRLRYKAVPRIYHRLPADEDLYALFVHGAVLAKRDVSSAVAASHRLPFSSLRTRSVKKARKEGLTVELSADYESFVAIETEVLAAKGAKPVHSADELTLLARRFPDNVKLFAAARPGGPMLGGIVIFESDFVAHAQHIAASAEGKEVGAIDLVVEQLLHGVYVDKRYFDLGTSMAPDGTGLNAGLINQKEMFGARACVYDVYELELKP